MAIFTLRTGPETPGRDTSAHMIQLKKMPVAYLAAALCLLLAAACGGRGGRTPQERPSARYRFLPAAPPAGLDDAGRRDFLRMHYWDDFDFADTALLARADTMHMAEAFIRYVMILGDRPCDGAPMDSLMRRASASRPMLDYFCSLAEQVLHAPDSPLRNDELYIPVLRARLAAPWYDDYERIAPAYDLDMALRNRVGDAAADFEYTLASGARRRLYDLRAEYVLLFFSNPECSMCGGLRDDLLASPMLAEMVERGRLVVLMLYPDADTAAWRAHAGEVPPTWIDARDAGCRITQEGIYDLRAIPSLYLLDRAKRVVVKDAADAGTIEEAIDSRE